MKNNKPVESNTAEQIQFMTGLLKQVTQPMIVTSVDRRLLYWNAAFSKLTGHNNKELDDPIISAGLTAPEWRESETKAFEKLQRTGKSQTFQKEYIRKDGSRVPVELLIYQLSADDSKVQYYIGLITDITERKQLEEALQKSERHYKLLVESAIEGIVVIQDRKIKFVNPIVAIATGYSREEMLSMSLKELLHPDNEKAAVESISQVVVPGTLLVVPLLKIRTKSGGTRLIEATIISIIWDDRPANLNLLRDITDRYQSEETLRQSEKKYRSILEDIREGYWEVDLAGNFTSFNEAICRILGYSENEMAGMNYRAYTSAEDVDKVYKAFNQVYRTGKPTRNMHYKIVQKDGTNKFAETSVFPRQNEKGETIGFRGVSHDITERKNMEAVLRESEEKYRTILDEIDDGYFEVDLAGNYTFANKTFCQYQNYSPDELIGVNYKDTIPPEEVDKTFHRFNQVYKTGEPLRNFDSTYTRKDGSTGFIDLAISPIRNKKGNIIGFRGITHDVTERKQMEESLRRSEERYRTIMDDIHDDYHENDLAGNYIFANDALCRSLGYTMEELIGMNSRAIHPPEEYRKIYEEYNKLYRTGEPIKDLICTFIRKDGSHGFTELSAFPMRNEKGEIIGFRGVSHDITERKKIEEALKQSEEKYRTILDGIEESYYEVDLAGNYTFFNDALRLTLGYSKEELIGMNYRFYTPPEIIEKVFQAYNQVYRTGNPIKWFPMEQIRKDGTRLVAENSILPIRNEKEEITGFRGVGRDVTERKQLEETLRQSEERYRTILEEIQENYFEVDLAGNYTFVNDAVCRGLGYTFDELIGNNFKLSTTSDEAKRLYEAFHQIYLTGRPIMNFSYKFVNKDGRHGTGELSAFPIRNDQGEIVGFRGVGHDITERLRMEETLRRSEERYRTLLDEMEEPYYEDDLTGNFTFVNDAMCRALGYSREELIGMNYKVYTLPEKVKEVFQVYNQVYRTGEPTKLFARESIHKDGRRIPVETSILPLKNDKGEIIGFRGISRDITGRKRAEQERRELEQKAQFASRLASVGELASGVAHEINNPLTGVIGYAHLLLARKDISRDVRRDLEIINEGAQRVAGIVKKLLAFARQTKPEQRYVNINELMRNTLELRAYELSSNNIKVSLQLTRDLPMTIADPGQLQQVFLNLIINAETEMKLANDKGKLSIKTERINNAIRITFKDTGPGIAKENLETIFDPFFTTREVGQGTGLGLSVCHGIVTEHNGRIWAESEPGKGATFIVELPLVTEEGQEPPEPVIEEATGVAKAKILVIDDEPVIRQFISQVLVEQGHTVETVDNAAGALKMVKSKRYRLILLDIKMPGMSGVEMYKQLQKIAPSLTKRVVFITGDVMGKRTLAFLDKTKTPYMMKPFDARELKTQINRILARK